MGSSSESEGTTVPEDHHAETAPTVQCLDCIIEDRLQPHQQLPHQCEQCPVLGFDISQPAPEHVEEELIRRGLWSGDDRDKFHYDIDGEYYAESRYSSQPSIMFGLHMDARGKIVSSDYAEHPDSIVVGFHTYMKAAEEEA